MSSVNFLIGKTLGKYKVLEHIGHGGMAEVYKGQQEQLERMVAVKVLHPFLADEEGFVVRFQREARIVATLRHPNIVQVYDFDYNEELSIYYMIMEFIDGPTLKSTLSEGPLSVERVTQIGSAIADALEYAHQRGMVHRDIKPANIMFTGDGEPVLTDFGIAKMMTLSGLTASGAMVGTPAYMAPEVGMGKPGTASADIYSLGVVLYELVTGKLPFESESPMGMVMQHINDVPPAPSEFAPDVPQELESVILQALEKQPEARFASAKEMTLALRRVTGEASGQGAIAPMPKGDAALATEAESATLSTPALTPPVKSKGVDEYGDRLVRTWPPEAVTPLSTVITPEDEEKKGKKKRSFFGRLVRTLFFLILLLALGGTAWVGFGGYVPEPIHTALPFVDYIDFRAINWDFINWDFLNLTEEAPPTELLPVQTETPTPTPAPTDTPTEAPTDAPTPTATLMPTPTPTLEPTPTPDVTCSYRLKVDRLAFDPDDIVAPETAFITYVSIRNNGNCTWPAGLELEFVSGDQMEAPDAVPVASLAPDQSTQIVLPMKAPPDLGSYESRWEVRQSDGRALGSAIIVRMTVGNVPTPTPLVAEPTEEPSEGEPLTLAEPVLETWQEDPSTDQWQGVISLQASGGTGSYRYYQGDIRADTLLPDGKLTAEGRRCEPIFLRVLATSGDEITTWEGLISYPDPEKCQ